jgi:hypothetical protein
MPFVAIKKGVPLSELVGQLFRIEGAAGPQARKQAEEALLQANPHLAGVKTIPEGAVIAVPEISGVEYTPQPDPAQAFNAEVFAMLAGVLQSTRQGLVAGVKTDVEDAKQMQAVAKTQAKMVAPDAAAKDTLAEAAKNADLRIKRGQAFLKTINPTLDQADTDLKDLQKRLGPSGTR